MKPNTASHKGSSQENPVHRHALCHSGPLTNPHEALVLGNGDLAALVTVAQHEVCFQLGKGDVWDARLDQVTADWVLRHDDLIRYERAHGFEWMGASWPPPARHPQWKTRPEGVQDYLDDSPVLERCPHRPGPKVAGHVRVSFQGLSNATLHTQLDLAAGVLTVKAGIEKGTLTIEAFISRLDNVLRVRVSGEGYVAPVHFVVEKQPDGDDAEMPLPTVHAVDTTHAVVSQRIPGGCDVPEFAWHLAAALPEVPPDPHGEKGVRLRLGVGRVVQTVDVDHGQSRVLAVAVATTREGHGDACARALQLAGTDPNAAFEAARETHSQAYAQFWGASRIELDDAELEAIYYRDLYAYSCQLSSRGQAPGLVANIPLRDSSPWHGDYHWNMNVQKMFLPALPSGHPEWIDTYARLVEQMTPTWQSLAREIFELEGVYCDLMTFPFVPPHRAVVANRWGRMLAMTGWVGQPLWWHWEYCRDRDWLRRRAYPYLKQAAQFYWRYLQKYSNAAGEIFPSMPGEGPGWTPGFAGNRNTLPDLVFFRKAFEWAIAASEELELDAEWRERWTAALARVPAIEHGVDETGQAWAVRPSEAHRPNFRAGWAVFPGEYVAGDEADGLALAIRQAETTAEKIYEDQWVHAMPWMMAPLRMALPDAFVSLRQRLLDYRMPCGFPRTSWGYGPFHWRAPEDHYLGIVGIIETMLQSHDGVIRLFPLWPCDQSASFHDLPAKGGFLISSEWNAGKGLGDTTILSRHGGVCRLRWENAVLPTIADARGQAISVQRDGRNVTFGTAASQRYTLKARQRTGSWEEPC